MIGYELCRLARRLHMVLNHFTLAFTNQQFEQDFRAAYDWKSLRQLRLGIVTTMALYAVFGVLDRSIIPEVQETAAVIRYAVVCPLALGVLALSFRRSFVRHGL